MSLRTGSLLLPLTAGIAGWVIFFFAISFTGHAIYHEVHNIGLFIAIYTSPLLGIGCAFATFKWWNRNKVR